jgi:predicted outer membrane repeat protein
VSFIMRFVSRGGGDFYRHGPPPTRTTTRATRIVLCAKQFERLTTLGQRHNQFRSLSFKHVTLTQGEILIAFDDCLRYCNDQRKRREELIVSGNNSSRVFRVQLFSELVVNDLTIKNGNGTGGGVLGGGNIYNGGRLTLNRVLVSGGVTNGANGAGLYTNGGNVNINNSTFNDNSALPSGEGGAIYAVSGGLTVRNSTLYGNRAKALGGAIASRASSITLFSSTVTANDADRAGGVYYEAGNSQILTLSNNIIAGNNANVDAATRDVYTFQTSVGNSGYNLIGDSRAGSGWTATDLLDRNPLLGSFGDNGGQTPTVSLLAGSPAIDAGASSLTVDQRGSYRPVDGDNNGSTADDIGAFEVQPAPLVVNNGAGDTDRVCDSHCTLKDAVFVGSNRRGDNRIVFNLPASARTISIVDFSIEFGPYPVIIDGGNLITITGGNLRLVALYSGNKVTLTNLTVSGGEGILNSGGDLTLENVRVTAVSNSSGLANLSGTVTIRNSLFDSNQNPTQGSGIYNDGTAYIENSTFANNIGGDGGAIANRETMTLVNCTIAYNRATTFSNSQGGGIDGRNGSTTLLNTIIFGNTAGFGPDARGTFNSQGYNLIGNTESNSGFGAVGDVINPAGGAELATTTAIINGQSQTVALLASNGGATQTVALLSASPAIDAAAPFGNLVTDQRGFFRPADGNADGAARADIGAFERVPALDLQAGSDTGASQTDNLTNDLTPTFELAGVSAGATIALFRGASLVASATSAGGVVSITDPNAPANGAATYEARITAGGAINVSNSLTVNFDTMRPSVTINQAAGQPDPSDVQPVRYTTVFSEIVTNFSGAGVSLSGTANVSGAAKNVIGSGANYTIEVSRVSTDGTVVANVQQDSAFDLAGNGNLASTSTDNTITVAGDAFDSFVVTRADDLGPLGACDADCTLREALAAADASRGEETISFSPAVFNIARTVVLTSELLISSDVIINGTGINSLTLSGNNATRVLRVANGAIASINSLTIKNGKTANVNGDSFGGAIYNSGNLTLGGVSVTNNTAENAGGAIYNQGALTINASTVAVNSASDPVNSELNTEGGGIYNQAGSLTIISSTVSDNFAVSNGGGIAISSGTVKIINSTLANNSLTAGFGYGGALYLISGTIEFTNSTVALNIVQSGAGGISYIGATAGALRFRNTLIAGNTGINIQSPGAIITSYGNNLFGTTAGIRSTTVYQSSDKRDVNARLGAFGENGGATKTVAILADSPALNAGSDCVINLSCASNNPPAALTNDQRGAGFARKSGSSVDIGAFEMQLAPTAAAVSIGGCVTEPNGRGLANASVLLTDAAGATRLTQTNNFGYYRFAEIPSGATYILAVRAKRFNVEPQVVNITEEKLDINFTGTFTNLNFLNK